MQDYERVSYFSNALQIALETIGLSRAALAEKISIPPSTLHCHVHGTARPSVDDLEKICSVLSPENRAALVVAHLRDETPASAEELIQIVSLVGAKVKQETANKERIVSLPKRVREDFEFLELMAMKHPEVVDSIRSTVRILKGR